MPAGMPMQIAIKSAIAASCSVTGSLSLTSAATGALRRIDSPRLPDRDRKSTRLNSSHTEIYTLSLHDALPIYQECHCGKLQRDRQLVPHKCCDRGLEAHRFAQVARQRSEERRVGKECRSLCDWSSDVCSSDLSRVPLRQAAA